LITAISRRKAQQPSMSIMRAAFSVRMMIPQRESVSPVVYHLRLVPMAFHIAGIGRGTVEYFRGEQTAPHDFAQGGVFEIA
jgi:hypothetical protein